MKGVFLLLVLLALCANASNYTQCTWPTTTYCNSTSSSICTSQVSGVCISLGSTSSIYTCDPPSIIELLWFSPGCPGSPDGGSTKYELGMCSIGPDGQSYVFTCRGDSLPVGVVGVVLLSLFVFFTTK